MNMERTMPPRPSQNKGLTHGKLDVPRTAMALDGLYGMNLDLKYYLFYFSDGIEDVAERMPPLVASHVDGLAEIYDNKPLMESMKLPITIDKFDISDTGPSIREQVFNAIDKLEPESGLHIAKTRHGWIAFGQY